MSEEPKDAPKPSLATALAIPLGTLGAVLGAFLGGYLFNYMLQRNIYMPLLVGGIVGFVTVGFARRGGVVLAVIAAAVALAATLLAPWLARELPRPDLQEFIAKQFHQPGLMVVLLICSPVLAFLVVLFTPPKPAKKAAP